MASFALLNEEKKILRRKEKELERQQKINEIKAAPVPVHMGKWADASDDEDLNVKAPISDSETESEPADAPEDTTVQDWEQHETNGTKAADSKEQAARSGGKNKKEAKKQAKPEDEDLDAILGELGIDLPQESQGGASSSKKNRKKKEKEADGEAAPGAGGYPDAPKDEKAKPAKAAKEEEKKPSKEKEENGDNGEEKVLDEAAKQAALEALKKKKAAAGKKAAPSDAVKAAAAEAKKRAEQKKTKKDKSMYDR